MHEKHLLQSKFTEASGSILGEEVWSLHLELLRALLKVHSLHVRAFRSVKISCFYHQACLSGWKALHFESPLIILDWRFYFSAQCETCYCCLLTVFICPVNLISGPLETLTGSTGHLIAHHLLGKSFSCPLPIFLNDHECRWTNKLLLFLTPWTAGEKGDCTVVFLCTKPVTLVFTFEAEKYFKSFCVPALITQ